jgi:Skp family chaperone for outer membrane proteins
MDRQGSALLTAKERLQDAKELLGAFFAGTGDPAPAQSALQDSLAFLGQFLGSDSDDLAQHPEKMRAGLLQIAQAITAISTSTLAIASGKTSPEQQQVMAAFKAIEQEIAKDAPELAALNADLRQQALANADSATLNQHLRAAQSRLESTQTAFEDLLKNQALSLDELLTGLERLVKDLGPKLGIAPRPSRDTYAEVSKEVGMAIDEANKKNMIQEDFDWSTIWKKD